jgi:predicted alpha/beta hydrolase
MIPVTLVAADGYPLQATLYRAPKERRVAVLAGATGVPQAFYRRLSHWLAERGTTVLTFDYRGIGQSAPASLKGFQANYLDWAQRDLPAAVSWASQHTQPSIIAHSFGGQAFGLLPDPNATRGLYTFGVGAGWSGYMARAERVRVWMLWHVISPVLTRLHGYLPMSKVGMGEDLPLGVYRHWKHWCGMPNYFFDDPRFDFAAQFARVTVPVVGVNVTDDAWAPPRSAEVFLRGYQNAPVERVAVPATPSGVGHMGYVREKFAPVFWPALHEWLVARDD